MVKGNKIKLKTQIEVLLDMHGELIKVRKELESFIFQTRYCGHINGELLKTLKKYGRHIMSCGVHALDPRLWEEE